VSSIRLFEAMRAGCVPVIISDDWIEPPCGNWSSFSIRIPESDVARIPDVCSSRFDHAREMGMLAASTFRRYFAPDVFLDNAVDAIREYSMMAPQSFTARALRTISSREFRTMVSRMKQKMMAIDQRDPS